MLRTIINWLLPSACVLCNDPSNLTIDLCQGCHADLPWLTSACQVCAIPLVSTNQICASCLQKPPPFNRTIALWNYQTPINYLISALKFNHRLIYAKLLGELMVQRLQQEYKNNNLPEIILPMPLHLTRLRERGFNQAVELSASINKKLAIKMDLKNCQRIRATQEQASLLADDRLNNVKNAFKVNSEFKAKYVAVVDDVVTTGHTVTELCLQLKMAGVEKIDVWCCARTPLNTSFKS